MVRKPFAAFGRILYANYYEAGNVVDVATSSHSETVLFFSEGDFTARDKQTGEVVWQCGPGWFSGNHQDRIYTCTANTATVCWCYDPLVNQNYVPEIVPFHVASGQSTGLPIGTKLFLCSGTAVINGKEFTGPYQISVKTPDALLVASGDVYGLVFE
jgi:hypothetical protein